MVECGDLLYKIATELGFLGRVAVVDIGLVLAHTGGGLFLRCRADPSLCLARRGSARLMIVQIALITKFCQTLMDEVQIALITKFTYSLMFCLISSSDTYV